MAGEEKLQSRVDGSKMTAELRKLMRKIEKEAESTYADLYANNIDQLLKPSFIEAPFLGSN
ncbi:hypothetical protein N7508_007829 [Penicillium antarcticum]|uniref:uncharacterized protein n=1 Tax=Penicillium antarcticum TaxID=416450 RepID=UPI0023872AB8|nr:uncharacterized protein N7508_007829 [Penicillium antarcticum]KAJ5297580.1 hypothetical protein N7508_007829 [Penicillium antarcticum]